MRIIPINGGIFDATAANWREMACKMLALGN
jgi:hypothetical protein